MQIKYWIPAFAGMTLLAGCESIGDGSTLQSLEVRPGNGSTVTSGSSYKLYDCVRDQLAVIGTFTDGSTADFSFRARWTSSDPAVVEVSTGEVENPFISEGAFTTNSNFTMRPGTLIPHAVTTAPVTVTAEFLGLRSSLNVVVGQGSFLISPAPDTTLTPPQPAHLGVGTLQRFNVIVNRDGQIDPASALNQLGPINPLLWRFTPGPNVAFEARDENDSADFDKYTISNGTDIVASISVLSGAVTGVKADSGAYPIEAQLSLCTGTDGPANPIPASNIRVAEFAASNPLVLARETDFNGPGVSNGDMAVASHQNLSVIAGLSTDSDPTDAEFFQNLTSQVRYNLEPKDTVCGDDDLNCLANSNFLFSGFSSQLSAITGGAGGQAQADACFPFCIPTLASLDVDNANPAAGSSVTFTASAINPTPGIVGASYTFNFGDGVNGFSVTQASPTVSHSYLADGLYTATVRVTDSTGAITQNAGAVQVVVGAIPSDNDAPVAALTATPVSGAAPVSVLLNASGSSDPDAGDRVAVYEFDFGDGTVVRQTSPTVSHVYVTAGTFMPSVRVTDTFGVSGSTALATVTITGAAGLLARSNVLTFNAIPATLTAVNICILPDLACMSPPTVPEPAFTYPGQQFEAIGSFTATSDCIATPSACFAGGATTGTQKITRLVGWSTRPAPDATEFSDIAFVRNSSDDLLRVGQVDYLKNVAVDTPVSVIASSPAVFTFTGTIAPATLTVTNCATCPP